MWKIHKISIIWGADVCPIFYCDGEKSVNISQPPSVPDRWVGGGWRWAGRKSINYRPFMIGGMRPPTCPIVAAFDTGATDSARTVWTSGGQCSSPQSVSNVWNGGTKFPNILFTLADPTRGGGGGLWASIESQQKSSIQVPENFGTWTKLFFRLFRPLTVLPPSSSLLLTQHVTQWHNSRPALYNFLQTFVSSHLTHPLVFRRLLSLPFWHTQSEKSGAKIVWIVAL